MFKAGLAGAIVLLAPAAIAQPLSVKVDSAMTFSLAGTPPTPGPARRGKLGTAEPGPGEITVGLTAANHAGSIAKLHVYERTQAPIGFDATALRGSKALATLTLCGRVDMDAWTAVPEGTEAVNLSGFASAKKGCEP